MGHHNKIIVLMYFHLPGETNSNFVQCRQCKIMCPDGKIIIPIKGLTQGTPHKETVDSAALFAQKKNYCLH